MEKDFSLCIEAAKMRMTFEPDQQRNIIMRVINETLISQNYSCAIILGRIGCEKLVEAIIKTMSLKSNQMLSLNGLIHNNDNIILTKITQQLKTDDLDQNFNERSFFDNLNIIMNNFQERNESTFKTMIIMLNNIDKFCTTTLHTFLEFFTKCYQNPICILAITACRDFRSLCQDINLSYHKVIRFELEVPLYYDVSLYSIEITLIVNLIAHVECTDEKNIFSIWNSNLNKIAKHLELRDIIRYLFKLTNKCTELKMVMFLALTKLRRNKLLTAKHLIDNFKILYSNNMCFIKSLGLSTLDYSLMMTIYHYTNYSFKPFNFNLVYISYCKSISLYSQHSNMFVTKKNIVENAFQRLEDINLIERVSASFGSKKVAEFHLWNCPYSLHNELAGCECFIIPTIILQWINRIPVE